VRFDLVKKGKRSRRLGGRIKGRGSASLWHYDLISYLECS
jgi:hypothetical protein